LFQLAGPNQTVQILGVRLVGVNAENGRKLLITALFLALLWLVSRGLRLQTSSVLDPRSHPAWDRAAPGHWRAEMSEECLKEMERRYALNRSNLEPRVFWRLTDNWLELSVRFVTEGHGIRYVKDSMSRDIVKEFESAGLSIASGTYAIVDFPEVNVRMR
jgi:hypothetical protein